MPTIVGTIVVWVTPCASMRSSTAPGSNVGMRTMVPPEGMTARIATMEAAWKIGVCSRFTSPGSLSRAKRICTWYMFRISASLGDGERLSAGPSCRPCT